ncbi:STAS domain-containing protein [Amycolatopsis sp. NPDC059657]|uniref:STAS domain-containing protein n=1 Tax=Amycolatopsis sp. NPDC059657 TaxID=3346899 RepID=UPI003670777C
MKLSILHLRHRAPPAPAMSVPQHSRTAVLAIEGEIDLCTAPAMMRKIGSALSLRPRRLVVDLSLVRFLDCAGLNVLLAAHRQAAPHTDLRIVANTRATWRPLEITRLHETLVIHATVAEAIAAPCRAIETDPLPAGHLVA